MKKRGEQDAWSLSTVAAKRVQPFAKHPAMMYEAIMLLKSCTLDRFHGALDLNWAIRKARIKRPMKRPMKRLKIVTVIKIDWWVERRH